MVKPVKNKRDRNINGDSRKSFFDNLVMEKARLLKAIRKEAVWAVGPGTRVKRQLSLYPIEYLLSKGNKYLLNKPKGISFCHNQNKNKVTPGFVTGVV